MAGPRIEWNAAEMNKLARLPELEAALRKSVDRIADAAGEGFEAEVYQGRDRVRGSVRSTTFKAHKAEAEDRALTRAFDRGRI
jgi:hypothetical protein